MVGVQALVIIFGILLMLYGANSLTPAIGAAHGDGVTRARRGSSSCSAGRPASISSCWSIGAFASGRFVQPPGPEDLGNRRDDAPGARSLRRGDQSGHRGC